MRKLVTLPAQVRALPGPPQLERLLQCPYAVLVVAGRSGSNLLQSHLDGHPQVAQIPSIWKFHDFLAASSRRVLDGPADLAHGFVDFPAHDQLFDTSCSTALSGQLGEDGSVIIAVDRVAFCAAMVSALGSSAVTPLRALYASVLAYEWCLGRDPDAFRVVLHHLHHGDWLWPGLLVDNYNLGGLKPSLETVAALKPDLLLVSLRDPGVIAHSYIAMTEVVGQGGAQRVEYYEHLLRLLVQDWLRARVAAGSDIATMGIRLEDMKADRAGTLSALCGLLGVDAADPALAATTFYGHAWTEDSWSAARRRRLGTDPEPERELPWQDAAFLWGAMGSLAGDIYPAALASADWNAVLERLVQAAGDPPFTLFRDMQVSDDARPSAVSLGWERVGFVERFRALADAQRLGPLLLCRRSNQLARLPLSA
ncbi:MAG: hypothetical protein IT562_13155 [Alphaproteobacteria bacterium]|nr:hypothetical protein [Alphaproteobacteria bacterium]